jgi:hypothetical protein
MAARSLVTNLEKFDGKNEISVEDWCGLVDDVFSIEEWNDRQQLVIASQQLTGAAATWFAATKRAATPFTKWSQLKDGLLQRFGGTRSAAVSRLDIARLRWKEGQDLEEHISRFTSIRSRISDAGDSELVSYFRQTLPQDYLNDSLYRDAKTLEKAIADTRSLYASRRHGFHEPIRPLTANQAEPTPMDLDMQQLVRALTSMGIQPRAPRSSGGNDNRKCYRCGNRGHIARFCPQRSSSESNGQNSRQSSYSQQRFRPGQYGPSMNARTYRLAELAYQIEQREQQQQQAGGPDGEDYERDEQGKGPSQ